MTLDQFFELLAKSPRRWYFKGTVNHRIRYKRQRGGDDCCPLTYAYLKTKKKFLPTDDYMKVADVLGLPPEIAGAADYNFQKNLDLRARLIKACEPAYSMD